MVRFALAPAAIFLLSVAAPAEAQAPNATARGTVLGGVTGAAIGGLAGGRRGAVTGAALGLTTGALIGSQREMERRRGNYYWYNNRCWVRFRNGEYHPVSNRYCR